MNWLEAQAKVSNHLAELHREAEERQLAVGSRWTCRVYWLNIEIQVSKLKGRKNRESVVI